MAARGTGRDRLLASSLRLFAEHGVEGTSLQMIADALGVTKAALYYHFKTKDGIVAAVLAPAAATLRSAVDEAAALRSPGRARSVMLESFVELILANRELVGLIMTDPTMRHVVHAEQETDRVFERMQQILLEGRNELRHRVQLEVLLAGLAGAGASAGLAEIDEQTLRASLLDVGGAILRRG